jgi:hypothetical protein
LTRAYKLESSPVFLPTRLSLALKTKENPVHSQSTSRPVISKRLLQLALFCLAFIFLLTPVLVQSIAQSTEERELEDKIPKHLPIRVKLKREKEKAFKDLKNEKWVRDLELEVTNIGDKPIYFPDLHIELPEIRDEGARIISFPLFYGRTDLISIKKKAEPEDVPLKPGETHVFSLEHKQQAWEIFKRKLNWPQPKNIQVIFQALSFGDGTGFLGMEGLFFPRPLN